MAALAVRLCATVVVVPLLLLSSAFNSDPVADVISTRRYRIKSHTHTSLMVGVLLFTPRSVIFAFCYADLLVAYSPSGMFRSIN